MMKFEEFRQLAEGANLIPVVHRVLADLETPVSVLARLADDENVFLLGMVFLFFINGTLLSVIIGVVVCLLTYFLEVLIDNCAARMKWQFALRSSWLVALVLGFVNLMVLYYL